MKTILVVCGLHWLIGAGCAAVKPGSEVIPGVTVRQVPVKLSGRLLFMAKWDSGTGRSTGDAGVIYEFGLTNRSLRKLVLTPGTGQFLCSSNGRTLCVLCGWTSRREHQQFTNAFLYSAGTGEGQVFDLSRVPDRPSIISVEDGGLTLMQLDPSAVYYHYEPGEVAPKRTMRSADTTSNTTGQFGLKSADDRFIFFEGANAPYSGYTLVSSVGDSFEAAHGAGSRAQVRVLKRFPKGPGKEYSLCALSPCRQFALVCCTEWSTAGNQDVEIRSYYVVDASTGSTWQLLDESPDAPEKGWLSDVYWVD